MANGIQCPGCGQEQELPAELAGHWSRCPACQTDLFVPGPEEPAPTDEESSGAVATVNAEASTGDAPDDIPWHGLPADTEPESSEPTPREPDEEVDPELEFATKWQDRLIPSTLPVPFLRKRGGMPVWLGVGMAVLFLALLIVPAWLFARWLTAPSLGRNELMLLPDQTESLLIMDYAALRQSPLYLELLKSAPPLAQTIRRSPVPAENISRLIMAETGNGTVITIIRTKSPLRAEQLKQRIKADNLVQEEVSRYICYTDGRGRALCLVQSDLIVMGQLAALRPLLSRSTLPQLGPEMRAGIDELDLEHTAVLVATPGQPIQLPGAKVAVARLLFQVDCSERIDVDFKITCRTAGDGEKLGTRLQELFGQLLPVDGGSWEVAAQSELVQGNMHLSVEAVLAVVRRQLGAAAR